MADWIWMNGEILRSHEASISVQDRGFQFADGVYEVIRLYDGRPFTLERHCQRLWNSAIDIQLTPPLTTDGLMAEIRRLLDFAPHPGDGMIYLQLTRGVAERNHLFPESVVPTLLFYTKPLPPPAVPATGPGAKLLTVPDERWKRCWVKSIALLPNVLAKNAAVAAGADEAVFVDHDFVTECSTSNLFAVINGKLVTPPVGTKVLPGITRAVVIELAGEMGIEVDERAIYVEEAAHAQELFITSTTRELSWVSCWNDKYLGAGRCGPITAKLHRAFQARVLRELARSIPAAAV